MEKLEDVKLEINAATAPERQSLWDALQIISAEIPNREKYAHADVLHAEAAGRYADLSEFEKAALKEAGRVFMEAVLEKGGSLRHSIDQILSAPPEHISILPPEQLPIAEKLPNFVILSEA